MQVLAQRLSSQCPTLEVALNLVASNHSSIRGAVENVEKGTMDAAASCCSVVVGSTMRTVGLSALDGMSVLPIPGGTPSLLELLGSDDEDRARVLQRLFDTCTDAELVTLLTNVQDAMVRRRLSRS